MNWTWTGAGYPVVNKKIRLLKTTNIYIYIYKRAKVSNGLCKTYTCNEETVHVNLDWQLVRIDLTLLISYLETDDGKWTECFVLS